MILEILQSGDLLTGASVAIYIIWFVINILICIWVYKDAEAKGKGGLLWCIIIFFCGCFGLIAYLIIRNR